MKKIDQSGQSFIEAVGALAVISTVLTLGLCISYMSWSKLWLSYQAQRGHYCLAEGSQPSQCQKKFISEAQFALPWGNLSRVKFRRKNRNLSRQIYEVNFNWKFMSWKINYKKQLTYQNLMLKARRVL